MDKFKAFCIHFSISAAIVFSFLLIVYFIWYPEELLLIEGGLFVILVLVGVDLVLGPGMTAIVYKKGKKGLIMDLSIIAMVQIVAFGYGAFTIMNERPQYLGFIVDRFIPIPASIIDTDELVDKSLLNSLFSTPKLIYITKPKDNKEREAIMMNALAGGKDREYYPKLYRAYNDFSDLIVNDDHQLIIDKVIEHNKNKMVLDMLNRVTIKYNLKQDEMVFYPIQGKKKDMLVVLNKADASLLEILDIDPWY
ncbi:MAG: hypothetical protein OQL19_03185 [Gammaproteobacteria bacterium]|nr:hypothetical protein [Gammaproteobacteria bacterium]